MAEVARLAGVSTTTVSHVLNKTRRVAPETEELVLQAVAQTGYRHNLAAQALATQSTDTIGVAMSVVTNPYFADRPTQAVVVPTEFHHRDSCGCGRRKHQGTTR